MDERLVGWSLGVLHASLLLTVFVAVAYKTGNFASLLSGIGTFGGLALGLWLGGLSVAASTWALRGTVLGEPDTRRLVERAMIAGGVAGALFIDGLFLVTLALSGEFVWEYLAVAVIGGVFGFVGGSLVGALFMALDVGLLRLAGKAPLDIPSER